MRRAWFWIILAVLVVAVLVLPQVLVGILTELMWFNSLGFSAVYWTSFLAKLGMFAAFGAGTVIIIAANLVLARRFRPLRLRFAGERDYIGLPVLRYLLWIGVGVAGLIMALAMMSDWPVILRFLNGVSFGQTDPLFGQDVSFYVFALPFWHLLQGWLLATLILAIVFTAAAYLIELIPELQQQHFETPPGFRNHMLILGGVVMLIIAFSYWLGNFDLLFSTRGLTRGASYTDANAQVVANWLMVGVSVAVGALLVANLRLRGLRFIVVPIGAWIAAAIVITGIYPAIIQGVVVKPSEVTLEQPYISNGIQATRQAFNLNNVEERSYDASAQLALADVQNNPQTAQNIRLQDYRPLLATYAQLQEIRTYYGFTDVDIDRYVIDGQYRQVMLSARQLLTDKLPAEAQTWVNQHIKYTHGYGLALSPVNQVTSEGLPVLLVKDIPPTSSSKDLKIDRPEIYYGTEPSPYVFVKTSTQEFDYPKGDQNVFTTYQGTGGVPAGGFLNRLAFAIRFGDFNILLTEYLTGDSRVMFHRQIQDAVKTLAPFLTYDRDPYLVVVGGKLYWIQDAYTTTADYPYSELYSTNIAYIRNSVKVVIDAYNGDMSFYIADPSDPLIQTYEKIFPTLFKPLDQMPIEIKTHIRYPEDMLNIQAAMYSTYHMQDTQVFYNKEDVWTLPQETYGDQTLPMQAYYVIMRPPGEEREDFDLILPFTPAGRDNLIGWIAAKSDGADYGKLLVFKFPKQSLAYGPSQIEARINQDPTISSQLTLWGQVGSKVSRGNLLVIPIGTSLLYVQPLYLEASSARVPELKRVIVATGNSVAMAETVDAALAQVFGTAPPSPTGPTQPQQPQVPLSQAAQALVKSALGHYNKAQEYLKNGDWANYGKEMDAMHSDLEQLAQTTGASTPITSTTGTASVTPTPSK